MESVQPATLYDPALGVAITVWMVLKLIRLIEWVNEVGNDWLGH